MLKQRIASFALAGALFGTAAVGTVTAQQGGNQQGGAAGVVAAVVQAVANVNAGDDLIQIEVVDIDRSLNNLRALNNVLNNSPILSNDAIDITVQDISVLDGATIQLLEDANIVLNDVVGVAVLSGGDLIVFTR